MLLDLIFIALLALFTWVGYRRGFVLSLIKTFGWVVAIWLAAKWTTGLSVYVRVLLFTGNEYTERAIAFGVGLIFVKIAYYAITLLFSKKHHEDDVIGLADSIAGAAIGFASGAIFVLVLVMLIPAVADLFKLDTLGNMFSSSRVALFIFNHNPLTGVIGHISELDALKEVDLDKYKELGESALKKLMPLIKKIIGKYL
ncbi:MAG: CvpA family protein [Firmicutes bacterium]|nr:CvpA family protein [Bacillota bacterium]